MNCTEQDRAGSLRSELDLAVRKSTRLQQRRRAFLDECHRLIMFLALILAFTAISQIAGGALS